jgi:hypothetical protein
MTGNGYYVNAILRLLLAKELSFAVRGLAFAASRDAVAMGNLPAATDVR